MSSHHIVKEKQEPALFILGLDGFDDEHLGQLLEWSPTLVVAQNMYQKVAAMGIKIDVVICSNQNNITFQENVKIVIANPNSTILNAGLAFFIQDKYPALNLICNTFEGSNFIDFIDKLDLVIFVGQQKHYPIKTGFNKWLPANTPLQVFGDVLNHSGLQKTDNQKYNTTADGFFTLNFKQPFFFIAETL